MAEEWTSMYIGANPNIRQDTQRGRDQEEPAMQAVERKLGLPRLTIERKPYIPGGGDRPDGKAPHGIPVEIKTINPREGQTICQLASDNRNNLPVKLVNGELCPTTKTNKQIQRYIVALNAPYAYLGVYMNDGRREEVEVITVPRD